MTKASKITPIETNQIRNHIPTSISNTEITKKQHHHQQSNTKIRTPNKISIALHKGQPQHQNKDQNNRIVP